jgi:hypothetical protein
MAQRSKVVVIGPPGVGKKTVVNGLFTLSEKETVAAASTIDPGADALVDPRTLRISNKYFDVDLDLIIAGLDDHMTLRDAEAVILILSATDRSALATLEGISASIDLAQPQLVLVVSNMIDIALGVTVESGTFSDNRSAFDSLESPQVHGSHIQQLEAGAIDHGYEHVHCCGLAPYFTMGSRDKAGIARVYEALANVAWKAARMRPLVDATAQDSIRSSVETTSCSSSLSVSAAVPSSSAAGLSDFVDSERGLRDAVGGLLSENLIDNEDAAGHAEGIARLMEEVNRIGHICCSDNKSQ